MKKNIKPPIINQDLEKSMDCFTEFVPLANDSNNFDKSIGFSEKIILKNADTLRNQEYQNDLKIFNQMQEKKSEKAQTTNTFRKDKKNSKFPQPKIESNVIQDSTNQFLLVTKQAIFKPPSKWQISKNKNSNIVKQNQKVQLIQSQPNAQTTQQKMRNSIHGKKWNKQKSQSSQINTRRQKEEQKSQMLSKIQNSNLKNTQGSQIKPTENHSGISLNQSQLKSNNNVSIKLQQSQNVEEQYQYEAQQELEQQQEQQEQEEQQEQQEQEQQQQQEQEQQQQEQEQEQQQDQQQEDQEEQEYQETQYQESRTSKIIQPTHSSLQKSKSKIKQKKSEKKKKDNEIKEQITVQQQEVENNSNTYNAENYMTKKESSDEQWEKAKDVLQGIKNLISN